MEPCWNGTIVRQHQEGDVRVLDEVQLFSISLVSEHFYLPEEKVKPVYTPPIVDDAGLDIYRRLPEKAQQEVRDNIWRYLEQVQYDYPPEPRVEDA